MAIGGDAPACIVTAGLPPIAMGTRMRWTRSRGGQQ